MLNDVGRISSYFKCIKGYAFGPRTPIAVIQSDAFIYSFLAPMENLLVVHGAVCFRSQPFGANYQLLMTAGKDKTALTDTLGIAATMHARNISTINISIEASQTGPTDLRKIFEALFDQKNPMPNLVGVTYEREALVSPPITAPPIIPPPPQVLAPDPKAPQAEEPAVVLAMREARTLIDPRKAKERRDIDKALILWSPFLTATNGDQKRVTDTMCTVAVKLASSIDNHIENDLAAAIKIWHTLLSTAIDHNLPEIFAITKTSMLRAANIILSHRNADRKIDIEPALAIWRLLYDEIDNPPSRAQVIESMVKTAGKLVDHTVPIHHRAIYPAVKVWRAALGLTTIEIERESIYTAMLEAAEHLLLFEPFAPDHYGAVTICVGLLESKLKLGRKLELINRFSRIIGSLAEPTYRRIMEMIEPKMEYSDHCTYFYAKILYYRRRDEEGIAIIAASPFNRLYMTQLSQEMSRRLLLAAIRNPRETIPQ